MQYILLVYRDEKWWQALSTDKRAAFEEACQASRQDLIRRDHLIDLRDLQNQSTLMVRIVNGETSLSDRPVSGGNEQLIQLLLIQARDFTAAIHFASQMPQAQGGPIEVRSLEE